VQLTKFWVKQNSLAAKKNHSLPQKNQGAGLDTTLVRMRDVKTSYIDAVGKTLCNDNVEQAGQHDIG
jgi:hypothetical protein